MGRFSQDSHFTLSAFNILSAEFSIDEVVIAEASSSKCVVQSSVQAGRHFASFQKYWAAKADLTERSEGRVERETEEDALRAGLHLRQVNGRPNRGWLRTMGYGLTQQLIRQDLEYWMLYLALRPDRNHRLVSFPYFC